jgi:transmembrane protein
MVQQSTPGPIAALLAQRWFAPVAAGLLTLPYWSSGVAKLVDLPGAMAEARHFGLEPAGLVVAITIFVQLAGSILLVIGRSAWLAAGALGIFTMIATVVAHPFWTIADPVVRFHERNTFLEHVGLVGGFMLAAILMERSNG